MSTDYTLPTESAGEPEGQPATQGVPGPQGGGAPKGSGIVPILIIVGALLFGGIFVVGILAAIAIPNFVSMQYRAKRAEIPANVAGIKTAEIAYDAAFDEYIEVREFVPDSRPGFDTLGWAPDGQVRGSYRVTKKGYSDFVVQGMCDVDGYGDQALFTATKSINTTMNTGNSTY